MNLNQKIHLWLGKSNWHICDMVGQLEWPSCGICDKIVLECIDDNPDYTKSPDACLKLMDEIRQRRKGEVFCGHGTRQTYFATIRVSRSVDITATAKTLPMAVAKAVGKLIDWENRFKVSK